MAITQNHVINIQPGVSAPLVIHCSQGDTGTQINLTVVNGDEEFDCSSYACSVHGVRSDGGNWGPITCTVSGSTVCFSLTSAMTAVAGACLAEISVGTVGTANFAMLMENATFGNGVTYSNDVSVYQNILAAVQDGISNETAERVAAVENEKNERIAAVTNEKNERIHADNSLSSRISQNDTELRGLISAETQQRRDNDIELNNRVNQLVSPTGEAPNPSEITDARVGVDGSVYSNLGTAIRTQVNNLNNDFDNLIVDGDNLYNKENVLIGKVLKKEGIVDDKDWDLSEEITVMPDQKYSIKAFFFKKTASSIIIEQINGDGIYLSSIDIGLTPTDENSGGFVFSTGENTAKIRVNTKNAYFLVLIAGEEIPKKYFSVDSKHRNRSIAYNDSNISICTNLSSNIRYKKGTLSNDGTINNVNFWGLCTYDYIPVKKGSIITGNLNYSDSSMSYQVCEYSEPNENKFYIHSGNKTKTEKYVVSQDCYIRIAVYDYNMTIPARIDFFNRIQIGLLVDDLQKVEYENTIQISRQSNTRFYINPLIPDFSSCSPSSEKKFNLFSQNTGYQEFISAWRELCKTDSKYATYKIMGSDASETYDVYKMSLNEAGIYKNDSGLIAPREKPKILIISGVHGFEKASCFALYYFVRELIESNNEIFDYLRYNIDFEIVPVANPWGFENLSYRQSENININRDSDYRWKKNSDIGTGDKPYSAVETTYLRDFIKENYDAMLMIDWHTTGAVAFGTPDYTNWISDNLLDFPNENVLIANIAHAEYISRYINQKYNLGYKKGTMLGKLTHEITSGCTDAIACGIGVHGLCFEVSPKTENGNVHDETVAKMNTELFTHYLMTVIKQFQKNN